METDAIEGLWAGQLREGLTKLGLSLSANQEESLTDYLALLKRWNRTYNLTAVRDPQLMVSRHLLDSLSVLDYLAGTRIADVGSGPGLPGIPLAVALPDRQFVLLESNGKKARFLRQAKMSLGLDNLEVVQERVEQYRPTEGFDAVVSRAFASLGDFWSLSHHLLKPGGRLVAMKGQRPDEELAGLPEEAEAEVIRLATAADLGARHLVVLRRRADLADAL